MIFDGYQSYVDSGFKPTVCIIGSGPAGISLALQLEKQKIPCVIVEAGGMKYSGESQQAYRGNIVGDKYIPLEMARLRQFGGTSGHWAGWCRHLDAVDFEAREGVENSGWPITKKDLDPYRETTESILEIGSIAPNEPLNENLEKIHFNFSPPVRFGEKYSDYVEKSSSIAMVINSPVREIVPKNGSISHVNLYNKQGNDQKIEAKYYCLCTGGIENSRLLLWSNQLHNKGVVPHDDTLGKYWMEHPAFGVADTVLFNFTKIRTPGGMNFYAPTADYLRKHKIGNFGLRLMSGESLIKALIKDGLCVAPKFFSEMAQKVNEGLVCNAALRLTWEQLPVRDNRVELSDEKDALGMPMANLHWKLYRENRTTVETAVKHLGVYMAKQNIGRVKVIDWIVNNKPYPEDDERLSFHHMGGTRMAASPEQGVVDADCKVHGVDNLYLGGSSVFVTGGYANPTYTIVQLALRLGDHLAQREKKV